VNTTSNQIDGLEAQFTTFFDFEGLPEFASNFGVQANYTLLDANGLLGVSKHSYNVVGLFERGPLSARLSYNKRSRYQERRDNRGDDLYEEIASPAGRLDFSTNFTIIENATIFFDWTNITGDPFKVNFSSARAGAPRAEYVRFLRFEETTFSLGLRFRL
jgi:outer membrane receptor protein involved in Fe transport